MKTNVELYKEWRDKPVLLVEPITDIEMAIAYGFGQGVDSARAEMQEAPPHAKDKSAPFTKDDDRVIAQELANQIYTAYPRRVGRGAAMKAIQKAMKTVTGLELLEAVTAYAKAVATWKVDDRAFVPHPATWFNQERYADDRATWTRLEASRGLQIRSE
jgi:hypothetical protein